MIFQYMVLAIFFNYLRSRSNRGELPAIWGKRAVVGLVFSLFMVGLYIAEPATRTVLLWVSYPIIAALTLLVFNIPDLKPVKSVLYVFLPLLIVNFLEDILRAIDKDYAQTIENYFDVAAGFALVWLFALLYINNKQRKTLEKERLKSAEREKEFRITEALKAQLEVQVSERTADLTLQKQQLENTIIKLKTTQSQLIQSEKMASLGELTAGIAHEIQNPLNFINNFAEVNQDLIDDIKAELAAGNPEEAIALAEDLKSNNSKIAFHGKRADSIVKGMLQHSRRSSGVKEATDLNALADEYLRLAYHGLRAKDKTFNATLQTDYDATVGNVNIITQDIGRCMLNLITNAFYAVNERKKQGSADYEPKVSVSTKKLNGLVEIKVSDNGNGIPQKVIEKIFQPFFTTKPTGQGTGLGLSLSYDIIKAHGGEILVESAEGEGTTFTIHIPVTSN